MGGFEHTSHPLVQRVYALLGAGNGIQLDRPWPWGVSKTLAALDHRSEELAPSTELRNWFRYDPGSWKGLCIKYRDRLSHHTEIVGTLRAVAVRGLAILLVVVRDATHNEAVVSESCVVASHGGSGRAAVLSSYVARAALWPAIAPRPVSLAISVSASEAVTSPGLDRTMMHDAIACRSSKRVWGVWSAVTGQGLQLVT